jgi:hypothetical protein
MPDRSAADIPAVPTEEPVIINAAPVKEQKSSSLDLRLLLFTF